jgi:hypothetical protein
MTDIEPEGAWLRFFIGRLRLGLRDAKSPATAAVVRELIVIAEDRLDRIERAAGGPTAA